MRTWFNRKDLFSWGNQQKTITRSNFAFYPISFTGLLGIYSPEKDKKNLFICSFFFFLFLYLLLPMQDMYFARGDWAKVKLLLKITVDSSVLAFVLYW